MQNLIIYLIPGIILLWSVISHIVIKKKINMPQNPTPKLRRFRRLTTLSSPKFLAENRH